MWWTNERVDVCYITCVCGCVGGLERRRLLGLFSNTTSREVSSLVPKLTLQLRLRYDIPLILTEFPLLSSMFGPSARLGIGIIEGGPRNMTPN